MYLHVIPMAAPSGGWALFTHSYCKREIGGCPVLAAEDNKKHWLFQSLRPAGWSQAQDLTGGGSQIDNWHCLM